MVVFRAPHSRAPKHVSLKHALLLLSQRLLSPEQVEPIEIHLRLFTAFNLNEFLSQYPNKATMAKTRTA
jgi:hypothetical protein